MPLASFHYAVRSRDELMREVIASVVAGERSAVFDSLQPGSDLRATVRGALQAYFDLVRVAPPSHEQAMFELIHYSLRNRGAGRPARAPSTTSYHAIAARAARGGRAAHRHALGCAVADDRPNPGRRVHRRPDPRLAGRSRRMPQPHHGPRGRRHHRPGDTRPVRPTTDRGERLMSTQTVSAPALRRTDQGGARRLDRRSSPPPGSASGWRSSRPVQMLLPAADRRPAEAEHWVRQRRRLRHHLGHRRRSAPSSPTR